MPRSPDPVTPRVSYLIGRLHRVLRKQLDDGIRQYDLTVAQYAALSILGEQAGLSNAQLARRSFMSAQSAHQVMQALEQRVLVRREIDPLHGRIARTELTAQGRKILASCNRVVDAAEAQMLRALTRSEKKQLVAELRTCLQTLDSSYHG